MGESGWSTVSCGLTGLSCGKRKPFTKIRVFINEPIEAKKPPEVKPWVRRAVEATGVFMPANADGEGRLGWWGVEMARFLKFCKTLPEGTDLRAAMEGYGRCVRSSVPTPQDRQLDQVQEVLRCFQKGIENWSIAAPFCLLHGASRSGCLTGIRTLRPLRMLILFARKSFICAISGKWHVCQCPR